MSAASPEQLVTFSKRIHLTENRHVLPSPFWTEVLAGERLLLQERLRDYETSIRSTRLPTVI